MVATQGNTAVTRERQLRAVVADPHDASRVDLMERLQVHGLDVFEARDGDHALTLIDERLPDLVFADLGLPKRNGLALLRATQRCHLHAVTFIITTTQGNIESAVTAIREGASDYWTKPIASEHIRTLLKSLDVRLETPSRAVNLARELRQHGRFGRLVGNTSQIRGVYDLIVQAAPTDASVLIYGESGTGKELVARMLHELSPRRARPFVALNCAAIPEELIGSELFGHARGAFTDAITCRQGCFELAEHGTVFLDEIGEMHPLAQAKLLRVLQERTVRRLGGQVEYPIDVRVIAATNRDPDEAIGEGRLREDLFYRLNVIAVTVPPLRDRLDDIPLLCDAFLAEFGHGAHGLTEAARAVLRQYRWPGNVRELRNVLERATIVAPGRPITVDDLREDLIDEPVLAHHGSASLNPGLSLAEAKDRLIEATLVHTEQNRTRAAALLGISVKTLYNRLHALGALGTFPSANQKHDVTRRSAA